MANGKALLEAANRLRPDIIILDISMPVMNGLEAARQLRKDLPNTKLIVLTMHAEALYVSEALRLGVSAYVLKRSAASELLNALKAVPQGQTYITPLLRESAPESRLQGELIDSGALTRRQREVLRLVAEGHSAKGIASALKLSVKTVQLHKSNLMHKLNVHTTADLVKYAARIGIVQW